METSFQHHAAMSFIAVVSKAGLKGKKSPAKKTLS